MCLLKNFDGLILFPLILLLANVQLRIVHALNALGLEVWEDFLNSGQIIFQPLGSGGLGKIFWIQG
jgi:hypothetical protein